MRSISRSSLTVTGLSDGRRASLRHLTSADWGLLLAVVGLVAIGLATVHSASAELAINFLPRQLLWVALGVVALGTVLSLDYHDLLDLAPILYGLAVAALVAVHFVGLEAGGAQSRLGTGVLSLQPSEFAKLATALMLARFLAEVKRPHLELRHLAVAALITAVPMALVGAEPDLGSAAMFLPILAGMLLVSGVRPAWLVLGALLALLAGGAVWGFAMKDYQQERVMTFLQPDRDPLGAGYQVRQSKIAVGSGGLLGRGYMEGTQGQLRFLPARHTDFVFSVLAEEWGFAGVLTTLSLYAVFLFSAARVAMRARNRGGILLVVGLVSLLAFHILYNTAMVVGLVPITGIPLPFLSYGGSFTLMCFMATGLILSIDLRRYVNR